MTPLLPGSATRRWLVVVLALTSLVVATPAFAYLVVGPLQVPYTITTAESFPGVDDPDDEQPAQVWICKVTGPPQEPSLRDGENPIQVTASSTDDGRFNDEHASPVVDGPSTDCTAVYEELYGTADDDHESIGDGNGSELAENETEAQQDDEDDVDADPDIEDGEDGEPTPDA